MFAQDLIDGIMVILMFILRIGVPVALTLALGYWLEKKLRPPEVVEKELPQPRATKPDAKIIQLHCWDVKRCDSTTRAQCAAVKHPELPCWLALQAEGLPVREECFTCALYKPLTKAA
jgi:hypothetical protein